MTYFDIISNELNLDILDVTQIATAPINAIVELTISKTPVYSPSNNSDRNLDL